VHGNRLAIVYALNFVSDIAIVSDGILLVIAVDLSEVVPVLCRRPMVMVMIVTVRCNHHIVVAAWYLIDATVGLLLAIL
jgi:hypothetical protein